MLPSDTDPREPQAILTAAITTMRADHEHGASWLARYAAQALASAAAASTANVLGIAAPEWSRHMRRFAHDMAYVRPSMAAVANTVARVYSAGWPAGVQTASESELDAVAALARVRAEAEQ